MVFLQTVKIISLFCLLVIAFSCKSDDTAAATSSASTEANASNQSEDIPSSLEELDLNLLFVGNSLSYYNDMPDIVSEIAEYYDLKVGVECLCAPGYALLDHWDDPNLERLITSGNFDYVILQQGPSSLPQGASWLRSYGQMIKDLADQWGAETAFYQVWPSVARYFSFEDVIRNYANAARSTESILFPVGAVWKSYIEITGDESLYGADSFHPSRKGSFLAAWVIFHSIYPDSDRSYNPQYEAYMDEDAFNAMKASLRVHGN